MKKIHIIISYFFLTVFIILGHTTFAQTAKLYLITVGEYTDPEIGAGADVLKLTNFVTEVAITTVMEPVIINLKKYGTTVDTIKNIITSLQCKEKDVIMLVYTGGHGLNSDTRWPIIQLSNSDIITLEDVSQWIKATGVGLTITLYDACNHNGGYRPPNTVRRIGGVSAVYANLFKMTKGHIMARASRRGQYSLGSSNGSLFINCFIGAIGSGENKNWQEVLTKTKQETRRAAQTITKADMRGAYCNDINGICQQEPDFELDIRIITPVLNNCGCQEPTKRKNLGPSKREKLEMKLKNDIL